MSVELLFILGKEGAERVRRERGMSVELLLILGKEGAERVRRERGMSVQSAPRDFLR